MSCCDSDSAVQGPRPHKWGQGVSCGYLIWRWQLLLELLFYHAPMAGPQGSKLPLECSRGLPLVAWRFPLPWFWSVEDGVILGSISWQSRFPLFVLKHFFLLGMGLGLDMKWAGVPRSFGPTLIICEFRVFCIINYSIVIVISWFFFFLVVVVDWNSRLTCYMLIVDTNLMLKY